MKKQSLIITGKPMIGVGVYDGLSAILAEQHGFDFMWVSSFSMSACMGLPDAGLLDASHTFSVLKSITAVSKLPIVVDLDSGYGDPLKLAHAVRQFADLGVAAVCIEDNPMQKRSSLYDGYDRQLVSTETHCSRVRAALHGIQQSRGNCVVIARTEALVAGMGVDEALQRSEAYYLAGAEGIFAQSLDHTGKEIIQFAQRWNRKTPLLLAPTRLPSVPTCQLMEAGISHIMHANHAIRASAKAIDDTFRTLVGANSPVEVEKNISSVKDLSILVGEPSVAEIESIIYRH